jgi:HD superfamily phosphodiesterase
MKYKNLIDKFSKINEKLYAQAANPMRCHGPDHHFRVYENAMLLAEKLEKRGLVIDYEVLIPACFLHDMAAYDPDKTQDKHHELDPQIAERILKEEKYPSDKAAKIVLAIASHGSHADYRQNEENIETTVLRDADKMDVFGPLGTARIIMARTRRGENIHQIVDRFYTKGALKEKWEAVTLPETKKVCKKDFEYTLDFFTRLDNFLKNRTNRH